MGCNSEHDLEVNYGKICLLTVTAIWHDSNNTAVVELHLTVHRVSYRCEKGTGRLGMHPAV